MRLFYGETASPNKDYAESEEQDELEYGKELSKSDTICAKRTMGKRPGFWHYFFENTDKQIEIRLTAELFS